MAEDKSRWISRQVRFVSQRVRGERGLPFQDLLNPEVIEEVIREMGVCCRECVFTPAVTIWTFLSQVLSTDHSCRDAVLRLRTHLVSDQQWPCSADTSPYCKARQRLPEQLPIELARRIGAELHQLRPDDEGFLAGRPIKLVDGSTVSMPDTAANQAEYPQSSSQQPGLGFPLARIAALICWHTGAVLDLAVGPYAGKETGETALLRDMFRRLSPGDLVVADRYFGNWWTIAMLRARRVDVIVPLHQLRSCDFRRGSAQGREDHLVTWPKPARPEWMSEALYQTLPDQLVIRELRTRSSDPTTRANHVTLVTTLLDPDAFPKTQIGQAYHWRWDAELDLRSIKSVMQMDVLRCKSPEMVRKEIGMHLLGYNLIRTIMVESAEQYGLQPREISFKGTLQAVNAFRSSVVLSRAADIPRLYENLLAMIARTTASATAPAESNPER